MKINKSRLLQIIREEVELHEKNTLELDESELGAFADADSNEDGELSKKERNKAINVAIAADKEAGNLEEVEEVEEVEKVKHKGKEYKASDATMKAIRGGSGGAGKVTPAEFEKAAKQAKSWADDPEAVAAAGRIVAKKKAGTMEEEGPQEDRLFAVNKPHKLIEPDKKSKLEIRIR